MSDELKPPDPPEAIAARYAGAAKDAVNAIAQVGIDAFDKVNGPQGNPPQKYEPKDAIGSLAGLAAAALDGGISLARVALQVQWDRRVLLVADNVASIVQNGLSDVVDVAADTAKQAKPKPVETQQQEWVDTAIKLTGIAALRGAEVLETVIAGPGAYANPVISRTVPIAAADRRPKPSTLTVTTLTRPDDGVDVAALAMFDPEDGRLPADADTFTLVINTAGLPSGVFHGEVVATDEDGQSTIAFSIAIPETSDPPEP